MNEIGEELQYARESSGVSLNEASKDLNIKVEILENIEDGRTGAFKDIFELKEYISSYAKYLGLNEEELIDEFSMFLSWFKISKYCILTENIIQKYIDKLYISTILNNRMISVEMKLYATKIANELFWEM